MPSNLQSSSSSGFADLGFLPEPMQPGMFRICDRCGKWFALQLTRVEQDEIYCEIAYYRCKHCGDEIAFAHSHPDHTV